MTGPASASTGAGRQSGTSVGSAQAVLQDNYFHGFVRDLEEELAPLVREVLEHPYLVRLATGAVRGAELRRFFGEYNAYCAVFPRLLAAVAANVPDDETRFALVNNLWEEHGEGDLARSHRTLFRRLWQAVDPLAVGESTAILPSTQRYIDELMTLCKEQHFLTGLGAIGPGTEAFTAAEYSLILDGLRRGGEVRDEDLEFFAVHLTMDGDHYREALEAFEEWVDEADEADNRELVRSGALRAVQLEREFWTGLLDLII
jgi:pyrroloquinoline-quinone synthase